MKKERIHDFESMNKLMAYFVGYRYKNGFVEKSVDGKWMRFLSIDDFVNWNVWHPHEDWNQLMYIVEFIEKIIGHKIKISDYIEVVWWYNKKKKVFNHHINNCDGEYYHFDIGYDGVISDIIAQNKKLAVYMACSKFILWYNKTVLKRK